MNNIGESTQLRNPPPPAKCFFVYNAINRDFDQVFFREQTPPKTFMKKKESNLSERDSTAHSTDLGVMEFVPFEMPYWPVIVLNQICIGGGGRWEGGCVGEGGGFDGFGWFIQGKKLTRSSNLLLIVIPQIPDGNFQILLPRQYIPNTYFPHTYIILIFKYFKKKPWLIRL